MAAHAPEPVSHSVVLSDDVKFHEHIEQVLRALFPTGLVSRAHPEGDLTALRALMPVSAAATTFLILDHRRSKRAELWKMVRKHLGDGGRAVLVTETPSSAKDKLAGPELEMDVFMHHAQWNHEQIAHALSAILRRKSFGAMLFEGTHPVAQGEALIASSRQKSEFLEAMTEALSEAEVQRTRRGRISGVADEVLMNAIYDAPALSRRSSLYKSVGKRSEVELDAGMKVRTRWQLTDTAFLLCVTDPYGTFAIEALGKRLATYFTQKAMEINQAGASGSGVGLYAALRHSSQYFVHVVPEQRTEISLRIDLGGTRASRVKRNKEIYVFYANHSGPEAAQG